MSVWVHSSLLPLASIVMKGNFIFAMGDILQRLITGPAPKTKGLAVAQTLIAPSTPPAQEILQRRCRRELKKWIDFYVAISFKLK